MPVYKCLVRTAFRTIQAMYERRNNVTPSCNHFCLINAININYHEFVCLCSCLSSPACKWHASYYIAVRVLSGSAILFTLSQKRQDFSEKAAEQKICFDFLYNFFF